MDKKYQHDMVASYWTTQRNAKVWLEILDAVMRVQANSHSPVPRSLGDGLDRAVFKKLDTDAERAVRQIQACERTTGHEVAGFLTWLRGQLPPEQARWVYYGMTSSDLVDTALGRKFKALVPTFYRVTDNLHNTLTELAERYAATPMLGMTHGQPAEPTTLGWRMLQWHHGYRATRTRMLQAFEAMAECKLSGPVGTFHHNVPHIEQEVAGLLGLRPAGNGCGQVIPRHTLAHWGNACAQYVRALAKIAVDLRLMASRGEFFEVDRRDRVGSSAMPGKVNPILAERVCSLSRAATGYAHMLEPVDLWEDRDLTNSAVERIAIPDLMQVTLQATKDLQQALSRGWFADDVMLERLTEAGRVPYAAWHTNEQIKQGVDRDKARANTEQWLLGAESDLVPMELEQYGQWLQRLLLVERYPGRVVGRGESPLTPWQGESYSGEHDSETP